MLPGPRSRDSQHTQVGVLLRGSLERTCPPCPCVHWQSPLPPHSPRDTGPKSPQSLLDSDSDCPYTLLCKHRALCWNW